MVGGNSCDTPCNEFDANKTVQDVAHIANKIDQSSDANIFVLGIWPRPGAKYPDDYVDNSAKLNSRLKSRLSSVKYIQTARLFIHRNTGKTNLDLFNHNYESNIFGRNNDDFIHLSMAGYEKLLENVFYRFID